MSFILYLTIFVYILDLHKCADIGHGSEGTTERNNGKLNSAHHCGNTSLLIRIRIVGGGPSELGEWPWMVALYFKDKGKKNKNKPATNQCGGTLISDQWVLTAAHCLPESNDTYKLTHVRLGDLDLNDKVNDGAKPVDVDVKQTIRHSEYDAVKSENDIALVRLKKKVKFTDNIYPICLLSGLQYLPSAYYKGKKATIAGWGVTKTTNPGTALKHTEVRLGSCKQNKELEQQGEAVLDHRILCAGDTENDSCQGDSGGPLMLENEAGGTYYQAGVVSFGRGCALENYPGVYTKVAAFIGWINEQTGLHF